MQVNRKQTIVLEAEEVRMALERYLESILGEDISLKSGKCSFKIDGNISNVRDIDDVQFEFKNDMEIST